MKYIILYITLAFVFASSSDAQEVDNSTLPVDIVLDELLNSSIPVNNIPSILDELLNWQVPDMTANDDPTAVPPTQFAASCDALCSIGWEDDMTTSPYTRRKTVRCKSMNLTKINFLAEECNSESGSCTRVLEYKL